MTGRLDRLLGKQVGAPQPGNSRLPQYVLLAALLTAVPIAVVFSVQLWMTTAYTSSMDPATFTAQYYHGVYRYRLLGRDLAMALYSFLRTHLADRPYPILRDPSGSFLLYGALAISNATYFACANGLLLSLLWVKKCGLPDRELSLYFYYTLLLAMSMAVVTPYDQLAYLLLLVGVLAVRVNSAVVGIILVAVSAIAGTLNRETEFLLASFLATMAVFAPKPLARRYWMYFGVDLVLSLAAYVSVRALVPGEVQVIQSMTFGGKWAWESLLVVALLMLGGSLTGDETL